MLKDLKNESLGDEKYEEAKIWVKPLENLLVQGTVKQPSTSGSKSLNQENNVKSSESVTR